MKATTLLKRQHNEVKAIFKKLEAGKSSPTPLLRQLANDLAAHMTIEQEIFYPAIKKIDEDMVREGYEEHALGEIALKRLLACDPKHPSFQAHVTATKELIGHHVKEEEEDLFPKVEKKMDEDILNALGAQMKARFDEVIAEGFEAAVPKGYAKTSSDVSLPAL